MSKSFYAVGPLFGFECDSSDYNEETHSALKVFLDRALVEYGEHSVFFVSWETATSWKVV